MPRFNEFIESLCNTQGTSHVCFLLFNINKSKNIKGVDN